MLERITARAALITREEAEQLAAIGLAAEADRIWARASSQLGPNRVGSHPADADHGLAERLSRHIDDPAYFGRDEPNATDSGGPILLSPWRDGAIAASAAALAYAFSYLLTREERELMARPWAMVIGDPRGTIGW